MWRNSERIATVVLLIWGLVLVPHQIWSWSQSWMVTGVATALIFVSAAVVGVGFFFPSLKQWLSGYQRYQTDSLLLRRYGTIHVDQNFKATLMRQTDTVFLGKPQRGDLVDMMDSLPGYTPEQSNYSSPDSRIVDSKLMESRLIVFWEPNSGEIEPLTPYRHEMRHTSPCPYGIDSFYHEIYFDRRTGVSELEMFFEHSVEEAVAIAAPRHHGRTTEHTLYRYYHTKPRRGCEQPALSRDGRTLRWTVREPKRDRSYFVFGVYQGEKDAFLRRMEAELTAAPFGRIATTLARPSIATPLIATAVAAMSSALYGVSQGTLAVGAGTAAVAYPVLRVAARARQSRSPRD